MSALATIALWLGYGVLGVFALAVVLGVGLLVWRYFPMRWDAFRVPPGAVPMRVRNGTYGVRWWVGLSGRRSARWFFGFMTFEGPDRNAGGAG